MKLDLAVMLFLGFVLLVHCSGTEGLNNKVKILMGGFKSIPENSSPFSELS